MKAPVIFDFDKTLTKKDTLFGFYCCTNQNNLLFKIKRVILLIGSFLFKVRVINNDQLKRIGVSLYLSGLSYEWIEEKSIEYSGKIELNQIYQQYFLKTPKENRIIISASFEIYLKKIFPKENVIGSKLAYEKGKVKGVQRNLYGLEKKKKLKESGITSIDTLYTDSYSDLPIMEMADQVFLIRNNSVVKRLDKKSLFSNQKIT